MDVENFDVEQLRNPHESNSEWAKRRQFLKAHHDKFDIDRLVCLSHCYTNIVVYGCRYPEPVMDKIKELALQLPQVESDATEESAASKTDTLEKSAEQSTGTVKESKAIAPVSVQSSNRWMYSGWRQKSFYDGFVKAGSDEKKQTCFRVDNEKTDLQMDMAPRLSMNSNTSICQKDQKPESVGCSEADVNPAQPNNSVQSSTSYFHLSAPSSFTEIGSLKCPQSEPIVKGNCWQTMSFRRLGRELLMLQGKYPGLDCNALLDMAAKMCNMKGTLKVYSKYDPDGSSSNNETLSCYYCLASYDGVVVGTGESETIKDAESIACQKAFEALTNPDCYVTNNALTIDKKTTDICDMEGQGHSPDEMSSLDRPSQPPQLQTTTVSTACKTSEPTVLLCIAKSKFLDASSCASQGTGLPQVSIPKENSLTCIESVSNTDSLPEAAVEENSKYFKFGFCNDLQHSLFHEDQTNSIDSSPDADTDEHLQMEATSGSDLIDVSILDGFRKLAKKLVDLKYKYTSFTTWFREAVAKCKMEVLFVYGGPCGAWESKHCCTIYSQGVVLGRGSGPRRTVAKAHACKQTIEILSHPSFFVSEHRMINPHDGDYGAVQHASLGVLKSTRLEQSSQEEPIAKCSAVEKTSCPPSSERSGTESFIADLGQSNAQELLYASQLAPSGVSTKSACLEQSSQEEPIAKYSATEKKSHPPGSEGSSTGNSTTDYGQSNAQDLVHASQQASLDASTKSICPEESSQQEPIAKFSASENMSDPPGSKGSGTGSSTADLGPSNAQELAYASQEASLDVSTKLKCLEQSSQEEPIEKCLASEKMSDPSGSKGGGTGSLTADLGPRNTQELLYASQDDGEESQSDGVESQGDEGNNVESQGDEGNNVESQGDEGNNVESQGDAGNKETSFLGPLGFVIFDQTLVCSESKEVKTLQRSCALNKVPVRYATETVKDDQFHCILYVNDKVIAEATHSETESAKLLVAQIGLEKLKNSCWTILVKKKADSRMRPLTLDEIMFGEVEIRGNGEILAKAPEKVRSDEMKIKESNLGYQLLCKLGWTGGGIGKKGTGIVEPITVDMVKNTRKGLGLNLEQEKKGVYFSFKSKVRKLLKKYIASESAEDLLLTFDISKKDRKIVREESANLHLQCKHKEKLGINAFVIRKFYTPIQLLAYILRNGGSTAKYGALPPRQNRFTASLSPSQLADVAETLCIEKGLGIGTDIGNLSKCKVKNQYSTVPVISVLIDDMHETRNPGMNPTNVLLEEEDRFRTELNLHTDLLPTTVSSHRDSIRSLFPKFDMAPVQMKAKETEAKVETVSTYNAHCINNTETKGKLVESQTEVDLDNFELSSDNRKGKTSVLPNVDTCSSSEAVPPLALTREEPVMKFGTDNIEIRTEKMNLVSGYTEPQVHEKEVGKHTEPYLVEKEMKDHSLVQEANSIRIKMERTDSAYAEIENVKNENDLKDTLVRHTAIEEKQTEAKKAKLSMDETKPDENKAKMEMDEANKEGSNTKVKTDETKEEETEFRFKMDEVRVEESEINMKVDKTRTKDNETRVTIFETKQKEPQVKMNMEEIKKKEAVANINTVQTKEEGTALNRGGSERGLDSKTVDSEPASSSTSGKAGNSCVVSEKPVSSNPRPRAKELPEYYTASRQRKTDLQTVSVTSEQLLADRVNSRQVFQEIGEAHPYLSQVVIYDCSLCNPELDAFAILQTSCMVSNMSLFCDKSESYDFGFGFRLFIHGVYLADACHTVEHVALQIAAQKALTKLKDICWTIVVKQEADTDETPLTREEIMQEKEEEKISESNVGHKLLCKMGWDGGGIGKKGTGRTEPVKASKPVGRQGLGLSAEEQDSKKQQRKMKREEKSRFYEKMKLLLTHYANSDKQKDLVLLDEFSDAERTFIDAECARQGLLRINWAEDSDYIVISRDRVDYQLLEYIMSCGGSTYKYDAIPPRGKNRNTSAPSLRQFVILSENIGSDDAESDLLSTLWKSCDFNRVPMYFRYHPQSHGVGCSLYINNVWIADGFHENQSEAETMAAEEGLVILKKRCWTVKIKKEDDVGKQDVDLDEKENDGYPDELSKASVLVKIDSCKEEIPDGSIVNMFLRKFGLIGWETVTKSNSIHAASQNTPEKKIINTPEKQIISKQSLGLEGAHTTNPSAIRPFQESVDDLLLTYSMSDSTEALVFTTEFTNRHRFYIHCVGQGLGLKTQSFGEGEDRYIVVCKSEETLEEVSNEETGSWVEETGHSVEETGPIGGRFHIIPPQIKSLAF